MDEGPDPTTLLPATQAPPAQRAARAESGAGPGAVEGDVIATYLRHRSELFAFALHATRDRALAEDIVQEAFVRLLSEQAAGGMPGRPRAWLYRVAANLLTSRGRRQRVAEHWQPWVATDELSDLGPDGIVLARERHGDLADALALLTPAARAGLVLAARGYSGREVAATIGRTDAATRTLLCRARGRLRRRLGRSPAEPADGDLATIRRDVHLRAGSRRPRRFALGTEPAT